MADINELQARTLRDLVDRGGADLAPVPMFSGQRITVEVLAGHDLAVMADDGETAAATPLGRAWLALDDPEAPVRPNRCGHNEPGGLPGGYGQELGVGRGGPFCAACCGPIQQVDLRNRTRMVATLTQNWTAVTAADGTRLGDVVDTTLPRGMTGSQTLRIVDIHGCAWYAKVTGPGRIYMVLYRNQKLAREQMPEPWRGRLTGNREEYGNRTMRGITAALEEDREARNRV